METGVAEIVPKMHRSENVFDIWGPTTKKIKKCQKFKKHHTFEESNKIIKGHKKWEKVP